MSAFLDTSTLIYWTEENKKADRVEALLNEGAAISVQVLNEFTNVLYKKKTFPLTHIKVWCQTLIAVCEVHSLSVETHALAMELMAKYNFSFYDANIVASAKLGGCNALYAEDMQNGLTVKFQDKSTLTIQNPFLHSA
jgi:predicted nucleic acid-binding protein